MIENPILSPNFHVEFLEDHKIILTSENSNKLLIGKSYYLILSALTKELLTTDQLVEKLKNQISSIEIYYALTVLSKKGYIIDNLLNVPPETLAYWSNQGIELATLEKKLKEIKISVQTFGNVKPEVFKETFSAMGVQVEENSGFLVVITDDYKDIQLDKVNKDMISLKQPWMLIKPNGTDIWIGPLIKPGETGCWDCLKQRLELNTPHNTFYKTQKQTTQNIPVPPSFLPITQQTAANQTTLEVIKWIYFQKNQNVEGKLISFNTQTMQSQSHKLIKRPQCKSCGTDHFQPIPIQFKNNHDLCETHLGGYRELSAEETLMRYQHHVSPITGVVNELSPYLRVKDTPIYNYLSGHCTALQSKSMFWLNQHVRSGNGGKGRNWTQSKTGALCEAIERYSMAYHGHEPHIKSSLEKLGAKGIHPNDCMNFSDTQYHARDENNKKSCKFYSLVPARFNSAEDMDWSPVYSLTEEKFKYLPSHFCYAQYPSEDEYNLVAYPDSNGAAAGNSLEEATLQGYLELIERDGVAIWWYNRLKKQGVDIKSFNDPYFNQLIQYYQKRNRSLYVLDLTTDLNIPVFIAISHRQNKDRQDIVFGFGAHVDAKIALERALTEINQLLPLADTMDKKGVPAYRTTDQEFIDWLETATLENQPYLLPDKRQPLKTADAYPTLCAPNIYDSLQYCIQSAEEQGLETLVLDLTQPDIGLNVVKVIVPGLRHFWKRLAPGRLYEVPVKMGWQKKALVENQLNPIGLFI